MPPEFNISVDATSGLASVVIVPTITSETDSTVRLLIGGDICPVHRVETLLMAHEDTLIGPFKHLFEQQDLIVGNLECPLTNQNNPIAKVGPHLRARPECAQGLKALGFDVLTLANNHIMDMGEEGLRDTLQVCQDADLMTVGAGLSWQDATTPIHIEVRDTKIGIISFTENEFSTASEQNEIGCCPFDLPLNIRMIRQMKQEVDFLLVIFHGGNIFYPLPSPQFAKTCRFIIEMGASAIVCHHTHVISGVEYYLGRPIIYGVGNLLFEALKKRPLPWYKGLFIEVEVKKDALMGLKMFPFKQCQRVPGLQEMNADEMSDMFANIQELSSIIGNPQRLQESWQAFCESMRVGYLAKAYNYSKFRTRLCIFLDRLGINPFMLDSNAKHLKLLNLVRCEAHHELFQQVLESEKRYMGKLFYD